MDVFYVLRRHRVSLAFAPMSIDWIATAWCREITLGRDQRQRSVEKALWRGHLTRSTRRPRLLALAGCPLL